MTTKTTTVLLAEATKEQMRRFAVDHLGFAESPPNILAETLRAKIAAAWDKDEITVIIQDDVPNRNTAKTDAPKTSTSSGDGDTAKTDDHDDSVTIVIEKTEEDGGDKPVWLDVNNRGIWVPRGEEVTIRKCYEHVLKNAVRTVYDQKPGANGMPGDLVARQAQAYPYRKVS